MLLLVLVLVFIPLLVCQYSTPIQWSAAGESLNDSFCPVNSPGIGGGLDLHSTHTPFYHSRSTDEDEDYISLSGQSQ